MRHGLTFGIHSDDWVTEVNPLLSAWAAVNRRSASGKVYGEDQCLTVDEAMRAITLGIAAMLGQEHIKGSVTPGKLADFTVLAEKVSEANKETSVIPWCWPPCWVARSSNNVKQIARQVARIQATARNLPHAAPVLCSLKGGST